MKSLFPDHLAVAAKAMDFRLERQNVVASNLANIKTPGYQAKRLEFEDQLQAAVENNGAGAMTRTNPRHMPVAFSPGEQGSRLVHEPAARLVQGLDCVDLDKEMAAMAKNTMLYNAVSTILHNNFTGMKDIITQGAR